MNMTRVLSASLITALIAAAFSACGPGGGAGAAAPAAERTADYQALVELGAEFRAFAQPVFRDGVPDYSPAAMDAQSRRLPEFERRLESIDPSGWPVPRQVDYRIVQAEMNGLEFDHRVLKPWVRDPSFYAVLTRAEADVPAREGPEIPSVLALYTYDFPLAGAQREDFETRLRAVPRILEQARENLTARTKDLRFFAIGQKRGEVRAFETLSRRLAELHPELVTPAEEARAATADFLAWLERTHEEMPPSADGIGVEAYDQYMRDVHLVPFTWMEQEAILRRELERAWTALGLEEHRNRDLPPLEPAASREELQARLEKTVAEFMRFLRDKEIFTVGDDWTLSTSVGGFQADPEDRDFWAQVEYRDHMPLRCHSVHWLEKRRELGNRHPIRGPALLFNIWDSRAEGFATAFEETMLQAGLMDGRPRAKELVWVLLAFRAARGLGDLYLHSREWTLRQAADFAAAHTPRGWVLPDGGAIWTDLGIYLRQPGYGTSYVYGKLQFEAFLADKRRQLGDRFRLKDVLDEYFAAGIIPASLLRWELTGDDTEVPARD